MATFLHKGRHVHHWLVFLSVFSALVFLSSCATMVKFAPSTVVPSAEGNVKVKKDNNNNYSVSVNVQHLAEPNRLPQPQNVYVVWAETPNGPQNLGQLRTSSGLFSSTLKASLETVTPYKPTRFFITAESSATVSSPGNYIILNTSSF